MILDTSYLIDLMNEVDVAVDLSKDLENERESLAVPTPVIYELFIGVGAGNLSDREVEKINHVLLPRRILPLDESSAARAGKVNGELRAQGQRIPPIDSIIAGLGLFHGEPIITGDPDHFERVPDLEVLSYEK